MKFGYARGMRRWRVGEILGWGYGSFATPTSLVTGWMKSPRHRAKILDAGFRHVGIAVIPGSPFNRPRAATAVVDFGTRVSKRGRARP